MMCSKHWPTLQLFSAGFQLICSGVRAPNVERASSATCLRADVIPFIRSSIYLLLLLSVLASLRENQMFTQRRQDAKENLIPKRLTRFQHRCNSILRFSLAAKREKRLTFEIDQILLGNIT